ncbi:MULTISPECIES: pirin family protein [Paenibacillus]|uniref:pirin family protein n=1 Tax=Paenibacillus TaxID=44249 RepID=UPI00035D91B7|nr:MULTISPECIES: pirin family protein [Paenibacillus]
MITFYPASERFHFDREWLRGSHSFSFGEYQDPDNTGFGVLRVFNDDTIAPGYGFGAHPHSDMEIVSIVLQGQLRHEDNIGNVAVSSFGGIQRMSAGTGVIHTEHNASNETDCNLLQLWFEPEARGLEPSYMTSSYNPASLSGRLLPVVSRQGGEHQATIHQDLTIYLSRLEKGQQIEFLQKSERRTYVFVIHGALRLNQADVLSRRDAARLEQENRLQLEAEEAVFFMLIDLP